MVILEIFSFNQLFSVHFTLSDLGGNICWPILNNQSAKKPARKWWHFKSEFYKIAYRESAWFQAVVCNSWPFDAYVIRGKPSNGSYNFDKKYASSNGTSEPLFQTICQMMGG